MKLLPFYQLPQTMQNHKVLLYHCQLTKKQGYLRQKQWFDKIAAALLFLLLFPLMVVLALYVKADSPGPALFWQKRVTQYGREFFICKFRTMNQGPGTKLTAGQDARITKAGAFLRKYRLDEIPQLWNIAVGDMSFVGPRPEIPEFVARYTDEMKATLLVPAGLTSQASVLFRNEGELLVSENIEEQYLREILPLKMKYNLAYLRNICWQEDIAALCKTLFSAFY